jgi:hypothetical protein
MMQKLMIKSAVVLVLSGALGSTALAGDPHSAGTGQPNQSCEVTMVMPGNSASARGSAFNPNGIAGAVYANPGSQGGLSSGNTHVVSQYDVACFQQTARAAAGHGRH